MEEHGILMDDILKSPGKVVVKQYLAPKYRKGESEIVKVSKPLFPTASTMSEDGSALRPLAPIRPVLQIPGMPVLERTSSREHPPSPVGPRPQRPRPTSSPVGDGYDSVLSPSTHQYTQDARQRMRSGTRSGPSKEGSSGASRRAQHSEPRYPRYPGTSRPPSVLPPVTSSQTAQSSVVPGFIHAPIPVPGLEPKILPMITAPKVANVELQKAIDQYANMVNEQAHNWNSAQNQHVSGQSVLGAAHVGSEATTTHDNPARERVRGPRLSTQTGSSATRPDSVARYDVMKADKENVQQHAHKANHGGLGFGTSVPMSNAPMNKEMTNLLMLAGPEKKDKRYRRKWVNTVVSSDVSFSLYSLRPRHRLPQSS